MEESKGKNEALTKERDVLFNYAEELERKLESVCRALAVALCPLPCNTALAVPGWQGIGAAAPEHGSEQAPRVHAAAILCAASVTGEKGSAVLHQPCLIGLRLPCCRGVGAQTMAAALQEVETALGQSQAQQSQLSSGLENVSVTVMVAVP